jgi:gluconolactonase
VSSKNRLKIIEQLTISANERVLVNFCEGKQRPAFLPDGMTIDNKGNLYLALFGGHSVVKIDPKSGAILQKIEIPTGQVTSVAFGGPNLDILFVTTAAKEMETPQTYPAGSLFKVTGLGVTGVEMQSVDLDVI